MCKTTSFTHCHNVAPFDKVEPPRLKGDVLLDDSYSYEIICHISFALWEKKKQQPKDIALNALSIFCSFGFMANLMTSILAS